MKPHTKIYLSFFDYDTDSFIPCELCGNTANDVHHINARGMGGDIKNKKDIIENLMALCRSHHEEYGDISELKEKLTELHLLFMEKNKSI